MMGEGNSICPQGAIPKRRATQSHLLDVARLPQCSAALSPFLFKNISKRALGKILLSTLNVCRDPAHGKRAPPSLGA